MDLEHDFSDRFKTILNLTSRADGQQGDVLVVDDEEGVIESLYMTLSPYYRVHTAKNTTEAIRILGKTEIDVVSLDVMMPEIKGDEAIKLIRGIKRQAEVIILTGFMTTDSAIAGIHHGANDYVLKPFNTVEMIYSVQRAINKKRNIDFIIALLENIGCDKSQRPAMQTAIEFIQNRRWISTRSEDLLFSLP